MPGIHQLLSLVLACTPLVAVEVALKWDQGLVALIAPWDGADDHIVVLYDLERGGVHHMSWFADIKHGKTHDVLIPELPIHTRDGALRDAERPQRVVWEDGRGLVVRGGATRPLAMYSLSIDVLSGEFTADGGPRWGDGAIDPEDRSYDDELRLLRQGKIPKMLE